MQCVNISSLGLTVPICTSQHDKMLKTLVKNEMSSDIYGLNYPTKASGWTRLEDTSSTKTSHGRWEYYDKTLFLISKHCSCLGCPLIK